MSFFSIGDILKGVQLAIKLYDYGFAEENSADVRYRNFRNEILNFRILLERLNEALASAQDRYLKRGLALGGRRPYEPLSEDFEEERKVIIGNFMSTLQDCEALLETNKKIRRTYSDVVENLRFNLGHQQIRVDHLRHRLHFHSQKIRLVIDRLSLNLLTDLDAKVDDILAISEQNLQLSNEIKLELAKFRATWLGYISGNGVPVDSATEGQHAVSPAIGDKFYQKVFEGAPVDLEDGIPLQQGFDALLLHLEQSCEPGADQDPERYLLFLKARWLLELLKGGSQYKKARPGFYYRRAINQMEQAISERMGRPGELIAYDDNTLLSLPDSCFDIWPPDKPLPDVEISRAHPLQVRGSEMKIVELDLAPNGTSSVDTVTVFKVSDEHFRVVHESNPASTQGKTVITPIKVHVQEDKLIPHYAFPTLANPCLDLAIVARDEEELFKFSSLKDLHELQTALLGYEVSHDQGDPPIRCNLKFRNTATVIDVQGRAQLWQEPIGPASDNKKEMASPSSLRTHSLSYASRSRHDSINSSLPPASTIGISEDGFEAAPIKLPAIVVFTQITEKKKTRFALFSVDLEPGMFVNPKSCSCHRGYDHCSSLVIERSSKMFFVTNILTSDTLDDGQPNPNTFDIFPMRLPRPKNFRRLVDSRQTEYVLLKFKNLAEKKRFHKELDKRLEVRDKQIKIQRDFEKKFKHEMDRPRKTLSPSPLPGSAFRQSSLSIHGRSGSNSGGSSPSRPSPRPSANEEMMTSGLSGLGISSTGPVPLDADHRDDQRSQTSSASTARPTSSSSRAVDSSFQTEITSSKKAKATSSKKTPWYKKL